MKVSEKTKSKEKKKNLNMSTSWHQVGNIVGWNCMNNVARKLWLNGEMKSFEKIGWFSSSLMVMLEQVT